MTKFHSFLALAAMAILTAFSARADWNATVEWDTPGSVEIYAGGLGASNKTVVPASATKMDVHVDGSTAIYVTPAEGYVITGARCVDDDGTLKPIYFYAVSKRGVSIQSYDHNGHTIKVDCVPLTMNGELEVNVVNGREYLQCQFVETNRSITLHTGQQKIAFNKDYESTIEFSANSTFAVDPYIIHNGDKQVWTGSFGLLSNSYSVSDGDSFEIKYCETEDKPEAPDVNITIDYANDMAKDALLMLYNVTQGKTISGKTGFQAKEGDIVRFVLNTKEYDVEVNGQKVTPSDGVSTSYNLTFNSSQTVTISASLRQWGETTVIVGVKSLEGLEMRRGTIDGEVIDLSTLEKVGTETFRFKCVEPTKTASVTTYEITVSLKDPKVFVFAVGDCWIEAAETVVEGEHIPTGVAMPGAPLYVLNSQIVRDTRLVVFVGTDGMQAKGSDLALRDNNRNLFELKEGYNEFMIDKAYNSPFTVVYHGSGSPTINAYYKGSLCSLDDNETPFFSVDSESVAHIFAGKNAQACTISAEYGEGVDKSTQIVVDRLHQLTKENPSVKTFRTCEVSVTPGNNNYLLDGEAAEYEGDTHVFKARQNHVISITKGDGPQKPEEIEYTYEVLTNPNGLLSVQFTIVESLRVDLKEEAAAYIYDAEGELERTILYDPETNNMLGWNGLLEVDFEQPAKKGDYTLVVPADEFVIIDTLDGEEMPHKDFVATFTVEEDAPYVPVEVTYAAEVVTNPNGVLSAEFTIVESLRVELKEETAAYIYNEEGELDQTILYNAETQNMLAGNGQLIVDFEQPAKKGNYTLVVPSDEFIVIDTLVGEEIPHPDFQVEFVVEEDAPYVPVEVTYSAEVVTNPNGVLSAEFTIVESLRVELKEETAAYIYNEEGELDQTILYNAETQNMLAGNGQLIVDFEQPAKKGNYTLVVPSDEIIVIDTLVGEEIPHPDFQVEFVVEEDAPYVPVEVTYSAEVVTTPNGVLSAEFTIVESLRVELKEETAAYIYNEEGELDQTILYNAETQNMLAGNGQLIVDFEQPAKKGNYTLVVPSDEIIVIDTLVGIEIPHPDFQVEFVVEEDAPYVPVEVTYSAEVVTTPNGVLSAEFTIVESLRVELKEETAAYIYNEEGELDQTILYNAETQNMLAGNGQLIVDFEQPAKKGNYTLVVPSDEIIVIDTLVGIEIPHPDFQVEFVVEEDAPYVPVEVTYSAEVVTNPNGVLSAEFTIVESLRVELKEEATAYIYNIEGALDQTVIYNPETQNMLAGQGQLIIDFGKPAKKGTYRLVMAADEFTIIDTLAGQEVPHEDFVVDFVVEEDTPYVPVDVEYTVHVATAPNGMMYAEFTIVESLRVDIEEDATAYIYDAQGELVQTIVYSEELQNWLGWNGQLTIDFIKPAKKGAYRLVVPADQFIIFDTVASEVVPHEDFFVVFNVVEDDPYEPVKVEYTAEVATAPNGTMYAEFTIVESLRVDIQEDATAYIYDAEGEIVQTIVYGEEFNNMLGWNGQLIVDFIKPRYKGDYTLVVPADQFVIFDTVASAEVPHEDFVVEFTIDEDTPYVPVDVEYTYEVGTSANGVMYAEFTIAELLRVELKEETTAYIYNAEGELDQTIIYSSEENNMLGWNGQLIVDFSKPAKKGEYTLVVPADEFIIIDTLYGEEVPHEDFVASFTVEKDDPYVPVEVEYSYEVGIYPNGMMYIEYLIVESLRVDIEEDAEAYILDAEGEVVQTLVYSEELQNMLGWNGSLIVDFIKPAKKGSYTMVVPADQFTIFDTVASAEVPHEDFVAQFDIEEDTPVEPFEVEYSYTVEANANGGMSAEFVIVEPLRVDVEEGATAYILNAEGEIVQTIVYSEELKNMFGWNGVLAVDFPTPEEKGNYTLVVPADQFVIFDTVSSQAIEHGDFVAEFTVDATTGIDAIINNAESVNVVTLDGRVILRNASADQLKSLSTGIYIINGAKYLKR